MHCKQAAILRRTIDRVNPAPSSGEKEDARPGAHSPMISRAKAIEPTPSAINTVWDSVA